MAAAHAPCPIIRAALRHAGRLVGVAMPEASITLDFITFKKDKAETHRARRDDFYTQLIRRGIFFTPHHHGYICYRHTDQDLDITAQAIDEALAYLNEKYQVTF